MAERGASAERFARVGEVELCWQDFGDPANPPLLLVMGLGGQMILWPDELCELLAGAGFHVIRFDNRDNGRSTVLAAAGEPSLQAVLAGEPGAAPYDLSDMAGDAAGLLDALGIDAAHVVGASLGGMIAQTLAIEHPQRVLSLASLMSTTGEPSVGHPNAEGQAALMTRAPVDRAGYIESISRTRRAIGSPGFPHDAERTRRLAARCYDRGYHPQGTMRQLAAIVASGDRTEGLRGLDVPTVVIHGEDDPLIGVSGGHATAAAIPGARLVLIPGMGHDFPAGTWEPVAEAIVANAERAGFEPRALAAAEGR